MDGRDRAGLIFNANILADWCSDFGEDDKADTIRREAASFRWPGVAWPAVDDIEGVSDHQREALTSATCLPFGLLTGTPGTGKTYTVAALVRAILKSNHGSTNVACAAPTGKAAVRMRDALTRNGVADVWTGTIHQLLEIGRNGHDGEGWGFRRNALRPLHHKFLIIDEPSMLDTSLFASLVAACTPGTHLLLAGDPHQLPPVGHGSPLRDMIAAGLPRGHLSEVMRNDGGIVNACTCIKNGNDFKVAVGKESGNLRHIDAATPQAAIAATIKIAAHAKASFSDDYLTALWGVQVIVAANKSGPLSRKVVNAALQSALNPDGMAVPGNPFRVGDKIICCRNGWYIDDNTGRTAEVYVANGEMGRVHLVAPKVTTAVFETPDRCVRIPIGKPAQDEEGEDEGGSGNGCDFDLGWAITAHKAQGSEWPIVVILIDESPAARRVCSREWLYTAVSRAGRQCLLVGRLPVAQQMTRRVSLGRRKTFLRELLAAKG